ncbi:MAG: YIP1 family protein [Desulfobacterales bacterium]|nr:YIP1 family protein [Desulfobacterales bacterium]
MNTENQEALDIKNEFSQIPKTAIKVITSPAAFFRQMPKTGGFLPSLIFMIAVGFVGGFIPTVLSLIGLSSEGILPGLAAIVLMPVMVGILGFVGAAILFVIWKILGSGQSFETAYRGMAFCSAITPITAFIDLFPYIGGIVGIAWMMFLLVTVSIEVHEIKPKTAWVSFGIIGLILAMTSFSAEMAGRKITT